MCAPRRAVSVVAMSTRAAPRGAQQRKQDVLARLHQDMDAWVATSSVAGEPCMVPLSFVFHDDHLLMCTKETSPTAQNVRAGAGATVGVGPTRDVVLIEADAELLGDEDLTLTEGDAFVEKLRGWDPRGEPPWRFIRFRPRSLRAWRESNELSGSLLMRDGSWLV